MTQSQIAKFALGQIVRHRSEAFRGVVVDVDPVYAGPAQDAGPELRDQPFYRILASEEDAGYLIYAAEEVLVSDPSAALSDADRAEWFSTDADGHLAPRAQPIH